MKDTFDQHRDVWGPLFSVQLELWASYVFPSASALIDNGQLPLEQWGEVPSQFVLKGLGKYFSKKGIELKLLGDPPANYYRVQYFDYAALEYEMATHNYKKHIVSRVFREISKYIKEDLRILDCACGPGYEAIELSKMVPAGEVVAVDLSVEMISLACRNAKYQHIKNMSFYQADAQQLPEVFHNKFDMVYCQLNSSYFEDMYAVAGSFYNILSVQGMVILIEPYPNLTNGLSISMAKAANPYFERLYAKEEIHAFFMDSGFNDFYWKEIIPGIGLSIITKNKRNV